MGVQDFAAGIPRSPDKLLRRLDLGHPGVAGVVGIAGVCWRPWPPALATPENPGVPDGEHSSVTA